MFGAVIAGFMTGAVSLISLIISKEQKITEYRESRRQRIREETAQFLAEIDTLFKLYESELKYRKIEKFNDQQLANFRVKNKINLCHLSEMRHRMYLRTIGERSQKLRSLLLQIENEFYGNQAKQIELNNLRDLIIAEVQLILSDEWGKVKRGEPIYKRAEKWALRSIKVSAGLAFLLVLVMIIYFMKSAEDESGSLSKSQQSEIRLESIDFSNSNISLDSDQSKDIEKHINESILKIFNVINGQTKEFNQHLDRHLKILATRIRNLDENAPNKSMRPTAEASAN
jgi:hypothetical protein